MLCHKTKKNEVQKGESNGTHPICLETAAKVEIGYTYYGMRFFPKGLVKPKSKLITIASKHYMQCQKYLT